MRQDEPRHILGYLAGINDRRAEEVMASVITLNPAIRDRVKTGHREWPLT
jgi:hypothetical protein